MNILSALARVAIASAALTPLSPITAQQLIKCVSPAGKVEYRQWGCDAQSNRAPMGASTVNSIRAMPEHEIRSALTPHAPTIAPQGYGQRNVPTDVDIRNMETSANSITLSKRDKLARQAEIQAAKDLQAGGTGEVDMSAVHEYDQRAAARRQAAAEQARQAQPSTVTNCSSGGCWGTDGTRYNSAAGSGNFFRQDGKFCQVRNSMMYCN